MNLSEAAVFRWVLIVLGGALSIIVVTVLLGSLAGALWGFLLLCVAAWHGYRWAIRKWR